jgi:uroporphyrin-3 C-methyltransferase
MPRSGEAPGAASPSALATESTRRPVAQMLAAGATVIALVTLAWSWMSSQRLAELERGATVRLEGSDRRMAEVDGALRRAQEQLRDLQQRQGVIDGRVSEAQALYVQVEKLYRGLVQESADALLAEIESTLMLASQQLVLGVDPRGALIALEQIEQRLARSTDSTLAPLRRALLGDLERIRAYPASEVATLATRLDVLIAQIDQWPLSSSISRRERQPSGTAAAQPGSSASGTAPAEESGALSGLRRLFDDLQGLIRVRRVDHPESLLIAPDQAYFLKENLRLMLLNTRISLLARNETLFRADLERVIDSVNRFYETDSRLVAQALQQLRQLRGARLALEPPLPGESLAAVRAARANRSAKD